MHILYLIPGLPHDENDYKLSFLWLELKTLLQRSDIKVTVCCYDESLLSHPRMRVVTLQKTNNPILLILNFFKFIFGLKYDQIGLLLYLFNRPKNLLRNIFLEMQVRKILRMEKVDIIHSHFAMPDGYCGFIANNKKLPIIVSLRGVDINLLPDYNYGFRKDNFYEIKLKRSLMRARLVIVQCSDFKDKVLDLLPAIDLKKIRIIPNGVDFSIFSAVHGFESASDKNFSILFVGGIIERKGIRYLIEAAELLARQGANFRVDFVGDGADRLIFERIASEKRLDNCLFFHGSKDRSQIWEYFSKCDVVVLPSLADSFPNVLVEAMLHKKPVIGFRTGGIIDIIDDGFNGFLVNQKDSQGLYEKLMIFHNNMDLLIKMGRNGYQKAIKEYDINLKIARYIKVYQEITS